MRGLMLACSLLLTFAFARAHAADAVSYGPPATWVKPVATPKDDGSMAEAPAKMLLRSFQLKFGRGSSEIFVESYIRIQTPQGLQTLNSVVLPWKPDTDVLTVHKCQLIRGDKVIDLLADGKKFEVLRRENNLEYAALDGILSATLQPGGAEVGDVFNLSFSIKRESGILKVAELDLSELVTGPQLRVEMRASWDKSTPIRWRATQDVKGVKEARVGNEVELTWSGDNLSPLTQPTNVPARFWRFPRVEFTGYATWNEVSRTLAPLYANASTLAADSALKAEARTIAAASADPVARIEAVLKLAQERVRYVYLGMDEGNVKPAEADLTWQRKFGDCKGKTALIVALLRELGIDAEPVAVATAGGNAIVDRLPMLGAFNHVIVRARVGATTYWLDGAGAGSWRRTELWTPNYEYGLPISAKGDALLRMLSPPAAEPTAVTNITIDAREGIHTDAPFKVESRFGGASGAALYAQVSQLAAANREQALRSYWKKQYDFVEIKSVNAEYEEARGIAVLRMEGTAWMDWSGSSYETDGMRVGATVDYSREPGINADAPFLIVHPLYTVTRQRIELPTFGTFKLDGANYDVTLAGVHYSRQAKIENGVFTGEATERSLVPEISAVEARAAEKQLNDMWKDRLDIDNSNYQLSDADLKVLRTRKYQRVSNMIWRGNLLLDRQDYDAAFADFDAAVKADAKSASALAHRGLARFWKRDYDAAVKDFESALAIDARNAVALRGLGAVMLTRGELKASIEKNTEALKVDPDNTFALTTRAHAYTALTEYELALADTVAVTKNNPQHVEIYDLRLWLLMALDEKAGALAVTDALIAANPDSARAQALAGRYYSRLGKNREAMKMLDLVIAKSPTAEDYLERAHAREPADFAGRLADINAALEKNPKLENALLVRAQIDSERGNYPAAIAYYTGQLKVETSARRKRDYHRWRAIEYLRAGERASATRDLTAALADDPDGDSYNNFCWDLATARLELEAALSACDKALKVAPKDASYLESRGLVLTQLGRYDEAIAAYDGALAIKPKSAPSRYARGIAKNRRCQCTEGAADIEAALASDAAVARHFTRAGLTP